MGCTNEDLGSTEPTHSSMVSVPLLGWHRQIGRSLKFTNQVCFEPLGLPLLIALTLAGGGEASAISGVKC